MTREPFKLLDLFSGIGGFSLGLERTGGFKTVAFCEIDKHNQRILAHHWPQVPCYDDVRNITAGQLRAAGISPDAICGGFPCQDASIANQDGKGTDGERTGLFREYVRLVDELRPELVVMENVTNLLNRGFGHVLGGLAEIGYDAEWSNISARQIGTNHLRDRIWIVAYPSGAGWKRPEQNDSIFSRAETSLSEYGDEVVGSWRSLVQCQPVLRGGDGLSIAMERRRLYGLGNAVHPIIPHAIGNAALDAMRRAAA